MRRFARGLRVEICRGLPNERSLCHEAGRGHRCRVMFRAGLLWRMLELSTLAFRYSMDIDVVMTVI